jgi:hypothetical protein
MLEMFHDIKKEEFDCLTFFPDYEEDGLRIEGQRYKNFGEKVGGSVMGDEWHIILFKENTESFSNLDNFDAILRYGKYDDFQVYKTKQYICRPTIIGIRCKFIKDIEYPDEHTDLEIKWSEATFSIPYERLCILDKLGINCYVSFDTNPTVS